MKNFMVARLLLYFDFTVAPTQGKIRNNTVAVFVAIPFLAPSGKKQWDPVMVFDARLVQTVDAILRLQGFLAKKINSSLSYDCQFFFALPCLRTVSQKSSSLNAVPEQTVGRSRCVWCMFGANRRRYRSVAKFSRKCSIFFCLSLSSGGSKVVVERLA